MNEKIFLRVFNAFSLSLVLLQLSIISGSISKIHAEVCKSAECIAAAENLKNSMDTTVQPCDDFYQYACGNWPKNHKKDECTTTTSFSFRGDQNDADILEFLKKNNDEDEPNAVHKAREFFSLCLNSDSYNGVDKLIDLLLELNLPIFLPWPWRTDKSTFDYTTALAKASRIAGTDMFFDISVDINPYKIDENAITINKPIRKIFQVKTSTCTRNNNSKFHYMQKVEQKLCEANNERVPYAEYMCNYTFMNTYLAEKVLSIHDVVEKWINAELPPVTPAMYTLEEFQKMSDDIENEMKSSIPKINWTRYIEEAFFDVENANLDLRTKSKVVIIVENEEFVREIIKTMYTFSIEDIRYGLRWEVLSTLSPYADLSLFQARYGTTTSFSEEQCTKIATFWFSLAISEMYMRDDHFKKAKIEIEEMFADIRESYITLFQQASWMDDETKEIAQEKLTQTRLINAYADSYEQPRILDEQYGDTVIADRMLDTVIELARSKTKKDLNQIDGKLNFAFCWRIPPTTVNALYNQAKNFIDIPAALQDQPFYIRGSRAFTYGAIGMVVGHELAHGFDPAGRKYNQVGEIEEWWKKETLVKYKKRTKCFEKAYSKYETNFQGISQKGNSTLTLTEDFADNGGFKAALYAYRSYVRNNGEDPPLMNLENFTPEQILALGFANIWCENPTPDDTRTATATVHSPNPIRVNAVFKNSEDLAQIWNCPKGSNMNPLDEKCSLW